MANVAGVLFGDSKLNARKKYQKVDEIDESYEYRGERPTKGTLSSFFFGFMYEEESVEDLTEDDRLYSSMVEASANVWNPLNAHLSLFALLSAAAEVTPVPLITVMSEHMMINSSSDDAAAYTTRITSAAIMGASLGKFINGPAVDMLGARRTAVGYSFFLSLSLALLSLAPNQSFTVLASFLVEFASSVQWPCVIVILAAHYRGNSAGMYEGGVFVTSLGWRIGSLVGILLYAMMLRYCHWRIVALFGSWLALVATALAYLHLTDSPDAVNCPQNPIDEAQLFKFFSFPTKQSQLKIPLARIIVRYFGMARHVFQSNVMPSVKHILFSPTFWIVAVAHTGASTIRSSERVLGTYFMDSNTSVSGEETSSSAIYLSIGIAIGLTVAGNIFAGKAARERKKLVSNLYILSIVSCYALSFLSIPVVNQTSPELMRIFQIMAVLAAGFGTAVQLYHIPSLVGATFGCDKGLFAAYTDGVGFGLSALVWGLIVGDSVQTHHGDGTGWAYGWAAVALILILSAILMVEFMEHYFCRQRSGGAYETIFFA